MEDPEHVKLLQEFATAYQVCMNKDFDWDKENEFARLERDIYERKSRRMTLRWAVAASVILLVGLFVGRTVNEWRVCQNAHLHFLCTKPRISQAGALLLPKDFVSLSIEFIL